MKKTVFKLLLVGIFVLIAIAVGVDVYLFKNAKDVGAKCVDTFHQQFNESQFAEMYVSASSDLKSTATESNYVNFIEAVHRKLGLYKNGTQTHWRVNAGLRKTVVVLTYASTFEKGTAVETFTIVVHRESPAIQGYHIESPALIVN